MGWQLLFENEAIQERFNCTDHADTLNGRNKIAKGSKNG